MFSTRDWLMRGGEDGWGIRKAFVPLTTMNLEGLKYMGAEKIDSPTVMVYPRKGGDTKIPKELKNPAIKLFASEGSSAVFYWDSDAKRFHRQWLAK